MTVEYDEETDILQIKFVQDIRYLVAESDQQENFIFDVNSDGETIGIEILEASKIINQLHKKVN